MLYEVITATGMSAEQIQRELKQVAEGIPTAGSTRPLDEMLDALGPEAVAFTKPLPVRSP